MRFLKAKISALSAACVLATLIGAQASADNRNKERLTNERIIGGVESADGEFPSAVSLQIISDAGLGLCGGTLVTTSAVVTAAHCVYDFARGKPVSAQSVHVGFGSNSRDNQTVVTAQRVDVNPDFDPRETVNDIAIITIDPIELVPGSVEVAAIYSGKQPQGTQLTAVGWGLTTTDGSASGLPDTLKKTQIIVGSQTNCSKFIPGYKSSDGPQICTENSLRRGTDTCQGDSGTGVYRVVDGKSFLAGLTSYGANLAGDPTCALDDGFAVYTHVSYYREFIDGVVGEVLRRRQMEKDAAGIHVRIRDVAYSPAPSNAYPPPPPVSPYHEDKYKSSWHDHGYRSPSEEPSQEHHRHHRHHHGHGHREHHHHHHDHNAAPTVTVIAAKEQPYENRAPPYASNPPPPYATGGQW
ncbi:hypothetical protein EV175_000390 [Coemansia sp. RSA 1933]|nr:hypothetical protein EV175_000390 [Coemansia sp. RSA 1933]